MKHFLFVFLLVFSYLPPITAQVNEADSLELVRLYHATNGDDWNNETGSPGNKTGWLVEPVVEWVGIVLNEDGTRVKEITLGHRNLTGELIDLNLPDLERLDLGDNALSGPIPDFSNLANLKYLYLDWNALSGSVPDFNNLANLVRLELTSNALSGSVPDFSNLANLNSLDLDWNALSGSIPDFNNLANLEWLHLDWNALSGSVPDFNNLANLKYLYLSSNALSGSVPDFSNLANLNTLALSDNALSGSIPDFSNLTKLSNLDLSSNELSGSVPVFSNLISLSSLYLHNNQLTFSGLEQNIDADLYIVYSPQACIPISQNDNTLSVSAGGTLSNNTYTWFKDGEQLAQIVGDSVLSVLESGIYSCEITNSIATELTLCTDDLLLRVKINESDFVELEHLYNVIGGDNWTSNGGWLIKPVSDWYGRNLNDFSTMLKSVNANLPAEKNLQIYPNPISTNQQLNITYPNQQPILIQLYDISGKVLLEQQSNTQNQHQIQIPELAVGTYFVKIVDVKGGEQVMEKVVVVD